MKKHFFLLKDQIGKKYDFSSHIMDKSVFCFVQFSIMMPAYYFVKVSCLGIFYGK